MFVNISFNSLSVCQLILVAKFVYACRRAGSYELHNFLSHEKILWLCFHQFLWKKKSNKECFVFYVFWTLAIILQKSRRPASSNENFNLEKFQFQIISKSLNDPFQTCYDGKIP